MGLTIMFATPVVTLPCREAFLSLISQIKNYQRERNELVKASEMDTLIGTAILVTNADELNPMSPLRVSKKRMPLHENVHPGKVDLDIEQNKNVDISSAVAPCEYEEQYKLSKQKEIRNPFVHIGVTLAITSYSFFVAISVPGVAVVWSILGSSLGMIIGFVVPCACYLEICGNNNGPEAKWTLRNPMHMGALSLLAFSVVACVVCTVQSICELYM